MARFAMRSMTTALITGGVLVAGLAAPVAAQDPGGTATCADDADNDVRRKTGDNPETTDPPANEPKADITRYCVTAGPEASFHVSVAEPTDPLTDQGWQGATFIGWYVAIDDDTARFIDFSLAADGSAQSAGTAEVKDQDGVVQCTPNVDVTRTGYAITGVNAACLGGSTVHNTEVAMYYDRDGDGDDTDGNVVYDIADQLSGDAISIEADRELNRLDGAGRTETSVLISQREFNPGEAATVYLARNDVFADAAVGGILTDGPILVVPSCSDVPEVVQREIDRLDVDVVTALGETQAICEDVLQEAADGRDTARLGGIDRFATSVEVAEAEFADTDRVYVARSDEFIDAVAGGVLTDGPILLVPQCGDVPAVVREAIADYDPDEVVALGGTNAICQPTLEQAAGSADTSRIAGEDRYGTAIQIAQYVFPEPTAETVYLARADLVVDALAGGVLTDGPVLVVDSCGDFDDPNLRHLQAVGSEITRNAPAEIVALGGEVAICDDTLEQAGAF